MHKKDAPTEFEKLVSRGKELYRYVPSVKQVEKFEKPILWIGDSAYWPLFFAMPPADAKNRFNWKLVKEDKWYIYLEATPRAKKDLSDFQAARLVLLKDSFLPRQVWLQQSGTGVTWDLVRLDTTANLKKEDFVVDIPNGWRLQPIALPPRKMEREPVEPPMP